MLLAHAGLKAEKEGLKASEKSDNIVRSGYDKAANTADKAKDKLKVKISLKYLCDII